MDPTTTSTITYQCVNTNCSEHNIPKTSDRVWSPPPLCGECQQVLVEI
jgi:hypothetical protein